ncbi:hypothetical protein C8F04DRAFT_1275954 [Mycena alexandri]|uniref:Uncharacterized protein n=1 Tax=Mycena alexandri TaxID=1745969 RepID=A0AAD6WNW4_9AGAR|nr:hypothetical protein C8F04DRAFT_1275954 [Mycena alexandri]
MASESSARVTAAPLRRRMHFLERAGRSFTSGASSTRNGDADGEDHTEVESLPSPPTSYFGGYEEEEEENDEASEERVSSNDDGTATPGRAAADEHKEDEEAHQSRPWYKPSAPVLIALAPPLGNWLTGGDHLKDLLLVLLLVFYLHQLVEVPWSLYHAARPRRPPAQSAAGAPALTAIRAQNELRLLELSLLLLCLATPALGVFLLRSLAAFTSTSPSKNGAVPTEPISWFSATIFGLLTALRPLRELISRITNRTSILHAHVHAHSAPFPSSSNTLNPELLDLRKKVFALETALARLAKRDEALYAYVEDALAPIEKGVRRVERRVGKLRTNAKKEALSLNAPSGSGGGTRPNTIFVPAQQRQTVRGLLGSLLAVANGGTAAEPAPQPVPVAVYIPPPISPTTGKRRPLEVIPEEGEGPAVQPGNVYPPPPPRPSAFASGSSSSAFSANNTQYYHQQPPPPPAHRHHIAPAVLRLLGALLRQWFAAGLALLLYPLYVVLLPVKGALAVLVGE